jgi:N-acyl-D-glucosamine 2-epimerase
MTPLAARPRHRAWLEREMFALLDFHRASADGPGGYRMLGLDGRPLHGADEAFELFQSTRLVHCFSLATALGCPGFHDAVDQGMRFLWNGHRDARNGGYVWSATTEGPVVADKLAYGHCHVLLAAASAKRIGHPDADRLLADVATVIEERFWEASPGAMREEFSADWSQEMPYRGANANMHTLEGLMAAYDATGERIFLDKALSIAALLADDKARACGWRMPEHFTPGWEIDRTYSGNPMFRPAGTTPGHALEWARLLIQLRHLEGKASAWMAEAARGLFANAVRDGWDHERGGFFYTLDWDDRPLQRLRLWWPNTEGIGAAAVLWHLDGDPLYAEWYERIWDFVAARFIDHDNGGWFAEIDEAGRPSAEIFAGKPDLYHSFQACVNSLLPAGAFLSGDLSKGG